MDQEIKLFKEPIRERQFTLPCGLLFSGELIKEVSLTPMTAKDRKEAADPAMRNNGGKLISKLLANRITKIGEEKPTMDMIRRMLTADRDFLLLKLCDITYPNKPIEATFSCSNSRCGEKFDLEIPLDEIEVLEMPEEYQDNIYPGKNVRYFDFDLPEWEVKAKFQFPDGRIQEAVATRLRQNMAEGEQIIFSKMILEWNGISSIAVAQLDTFPMELISEIEKAVSGHTYGPKFNKSMICPSCGQENEGGLDISGFLFR